ncbi:YciI family protein [Nocardioides KLBMP 9356]|uniref:YciI family protein n=1 Tax=Nocardioides potassii TaxID=2911371 RepID=A0ABS9HBV2_9ACTN|nr:YciI family protein [Nocardioides potassii]MCF6377513.1 YciI family protein [Nocardioides potassii]
MKYLVLLVGDGAEKAWPDQSESEQAAAMARFGEFAAACAARDGVELLAGEALTEPGDATVMRTSSSGEVLLTDGPYAEVIEGMGGFYLLEAPDLDVVVELLRILPRYDIQIHPTVDVAL